jgi:hypothetical protein
MLKTDMKAEDECAGDAPEAMHILPPVCIKLIRLSALAVSN